MLKKLKEWFQAKRVKTFSLTTTTADKGFSVKEEFYPEVKEILKRLEKGGNINNDELNILTSHFFKIDPIPHKYYRINRNLLEGMSFNISGVGVERGEANSVHDIVITLIENTYGIEAAFIISAKDFHQVLEVIPEFKEKSIV